MSGAELSVEQLLGNAREATGLSDFGDEWFMVPLTKLVEETNRSAGLVAPEAGAGMRIQAALMDRLQLEQYFKTHPETADEVIEAACAIVGLPRTGSTVVHRLLASVPDATSLLWWETALPFPFPDEASDDPSPRIGMAHQIVDQLLTEWPDFESIDPMEAEAIAEEVILLDRTFLSSTYDSMMPVPDYGFWQAEQDHEPAYRDLYRFMQVLQHQRVQRSEARQKYVLKTPHHLMGGMDGLLAVWPDVPLVMTYRDVAQVLPSYCSMCASLSVNASTTYEQSVQGAYWTRRFAEGLARFETLRATLPEGRVVDVNYADCVADPVGTAGNILRAIGLEFGDSERASMEQCMADNARENRPKHKYTAEQFGLTPDGIAKDFADYHASYFTGAQA